MKGWYSEAVVCRSAGSPGSSSQTAQTQEEEDLQITAASVSLSPPLSLALLDRGATL